MKTMQHIRGYAMKWDSFPWHKNGGRENVMKAIDEVDLPVPMRLEHTILIGSWTIVRPDDKGLWVEGYILGPLTMMPLIRRDNRTGEEEHMTVGEVLATIEQKQLSIGLTSKQTMLTYLLKDVTMDKLISTTTTEELDEMLEGAKRHVDDFILNEISLTSSPADSGTYYEEVDDV